MRIPFIEWQWSTLKKNWQQDNDKRECIPSKKSVVATTKEYKVWWRYSCYKRHDKHWYGKEGGDTSHIRHKTGKFSFSSRESLVLPYLRKTDAKSEDAWAGDTIKGKYYGTITYLRVTTVPFEYDDWGRVGGFVMDKPTLRYFYTFFSLLSVEFEWHLFPLQWWRDKSYWEQR